MIPQPALMLRAYLRDNDRLDLPPLESSEAYMERMKHVRRDSLKAARALRDARKLKEANNETN